MNTTNNKLRRIFIFLSALIGTTTLCHGQKLPQVTQGDYAWPLLQKCVLTTPGENVCVSPLSLETAMAMLLNGADDNTHKEIQKTFGWSGMTNDEINKSQRQRIQTLTSAKSITVEMANSIWINRELKKVKRAFTKTNKKYYNAMISRLTMNETAETRINNWCAEHTHDKIKSIVSQLDPATQMLLINALYFKGNWMTQFEKELTEPGTFHLSDGKTLNEVPMMHHKGFYLYAETLHGQLIDLPFSSGGKQQYSMYFYLPTSSMSADDLLRQLNSTEWASAVSSLKSQEVRLTMPRFKMEYKIPLNKILMEMGIRDAFISGRADFSKISKSPLVVSNVLQKTFLEVNEYGAEGAAVTAITMLKSMAPRPTLVKEMTLDRPFVYMIVEKTTQSILFMGKIENPTR